MSIKSRPGHTIANPLPHSQRTEIGGIIYQAVDHGPFLFQRVPSIETSPCSYNMDERHLPRPIFLVVARFHTHTMRDEEEYMCPNTADTVWRAINEASGGGSTPDWEIADTSDIPMYTIDPDRIYRLEPDTPPARRHFNPQRWLKASSGTCAPHADL